MYAQIIVDVAHSNVDRLFTYKVPENLDVVIGQRVHIPFGAGNKVIEGYVLSFLEKVEDDLIEYKSIIDTIEPYSVLTYEQVKLAYWIASTYRCVLVEALRLMIPAQLRGNRVREKMIREVGIAENADINKLREIIGKNAKKQMEVFNLICKQNRFMSVTDINAYVDKASYAISALIKKGVLIEKGSVTFRSPFKSKSVEITEPLKLTNEQNVAYSEICKGIESRNGIYLLHGVTGSGKTEVYMQAISKAIELGGSAIVLVPEISLTPQTVNRFRSRFGEDIAVLHSRLSAGERYDEWRRIRFGKVKVVVGARSAVFAPLENLRLIVVDEEHEGSYKSETTPKYNAIEIAIKRCSIVGGTVILGSATPSISSYRRAMKNRYKLLELKDRVKELPLPKITIADMREEFKNGNTSIFSTALYDKLRKCIDNKEKAILFINRRGYSTFVSCRGCGYVFKCPNCDVSLTYHKLDNSMKCHYCGHSEKIATVCPECGKPYIKFFGVGTQQVEEQLKEYFPDARIFRMDYDTTKNKDSHEKILDEFIHSSSSILIGTQMIAKGLDIPNVTLVGVVASDALLHIPDFRSGERTFELLTQVAGRAGRDKIGGEVVIQTYTPDNPIIKLASTQNYNDFYNFEIAQRMQYLFPPFSMFIRIMFSGDNEKKMEKAVSDLASELKMELYNIMGDNKNEILFLINSPSPIRKKQGIYRYQILIKLVRTKNTKKAIDCIYNFLYTNSNEFYAGVEINPENLF